MKLIFFGIVCIYMMNTQTDGRPFQEKEDPYRQPITMPYWPFRSNDFWEYIEYFRNLGAYHKINEMARTVFAHQPLANTLGYDVPYHEY
ncbi:hypothetical protein lerEdw1_008055 [Lerista edwardsae]|nr:hypothetical protein lerEdw1_008055 [Lerista edwardsae]